MADSAEASQLALALEALSRAYLSEGRFDAAEATLRQCIDATARDHALHIGPVHLACLAGNGQPAEVIEQVVRALIQVIDRFPEGDPARSHAISELQRLYAGPGNANG